MRAVPWFLLLFTEPTPDEVYRITAPAESRHAGGAVTVIDLSERRDGLTTVPDLLDETVGLQLRSLGGLGQFSSISVRGSSPSQTAVYLDGVPLMRGYFSVVDLSDLSADSLSRIEISRGLPPPERMGAGLGGAIDLHTRRDDGVELRAGGGSFGTRSALLRLGDRDGRLFLGGTVSYLGSEGDFTYRDIGIESVGSDDAVVRRRNNGFDQADTALTASYGAPTGPELLCTQSLMYKTQGIPRPWPPQSEATSLSTAREIFAARVLRVPLGRARLEPAGHLLWQREHFEDPLGEIGTGEEQDEIGTTWNTGGELALRAPLGTVAISLVPQAAYERYRLDDRVQGAATSPSRVMAGGAISAAIGLAGDRVVIEPALRTDAVMDRFDEDQRDRLLLSPRGGALWRIRPSLEVRASAGRYHRAPTFVELFGDRGYAAGNPDLEAESGVAGDLGVVWRGETWRAETTLIASYSEDLIVFVQNSQRTARAANVGTARTSGAELALSIDPLRHLRGSIAYTYLDPVNLTTNAEEYGKQLPGRARHDAFSRLELRELPLGPLRLMLAWEVDVVSGMYLDQNERRPVATRALHGAELRASPRRPAGLTLAVQARNLFDVRTAEVGRFPDEPVTRPIEDYLGYPLPGRAVFATVRYAY